MLRDVEDGRTWDSGTRDDHVRRLAALLDRAADVAV
jgi:hypothetical protein